VDQAAEPVSPQNPDINPWDWRVCESGGRVLVKRPARPADVVMVEVLAQGQPKVPFAGDQHPVQALAAGAAHPAFRDCVRPRRPDRSLDDPHADRGERGIECW